MPVPEFFTIAQVRRAQGRKGEVAADILTDFRDLFSQRVRVFLVATGGERQEKTVEHHWFHKNGVVLKFKGVDTIEEAERLAGHEVQIPASEAVQLDSDTFYIHDLLGCTLFDLNSGRSAGVVTEVISKNGSAPLLVLRDELQPGIDLMVPFAAEYLEGVDTGGKTIRMRLPAGIFEINRSDYDDGLRHSGNHHAPWVKEGGGS